MKTLSGAGSFAAALNPPGGFAGQAARCPDVRELVAWDLLPFDGRDVRATPQVELPALLAARESAGSDRTRSL